MTKSNRNASRLHLESLERRELLTIFPTLEMHTNVGSIELEMYDDTAPQTVANFLNYVERGDYEDSIFHRLVPDFVLQGGGFRSVNETLCDCELNDFFPSGLQPTDFNEIPTDPPVVNEFGRSNLRGTVAMAKRGNDPNSATNQFFFSLVNNSQNLDNQNGGFTVFAGVTDMTVVDAIAAGPTVNLSSLFSRTSPLSAIGAAAVVEDASIPELNIVRIESFTGTAVIDGNVYLDGNRNGQLNSGEGGLDGATVYLDSNEDGMRQNTEPFVTADELGNYEFRVNPGTYRVRVDSIDDYKSTGTVEDAGVQITARLARRETHDFGFEYVGTSWHNSRAATNVDGVNGTSPLDALRVINELTDRAVSDPVTGELMPLTSSPTQPLFLDVDDSLSVEPLDALLVINALGSAAESSPLSLTVGGGSDDVPPLTPAPALPVDTLHSRFSSQANHAGEDDPRDSAIEAIFAMTY